MSKLANVINANEFHLNSGWVTHTSICELHNPAAAAFAQRCSDDSARSRKYK